MGSGKAKAAKKAEGQDTKIKKKRILMLVIMSVEIGTTRVEPAKTGLEPAVDTTKWNAGRGGNHGAITHRNPMQPFVIHRTEGEVNPFPSESHASRHTYDIRGIFCKRTKKHDTHLHIAQPQRLGGRAILVLVLFVSHGPGVCVVRSVLLSRFNEAPRPLGKRRSLPGVATTATTKKKLAPTNLA